MATALLTTKLYSPPVRPDWLPRKRLLDRLQAGLHRKLTLVSAPAGSGKSTLVSIWISGRWLSTDDSSFQGSPLADRDSPTSDKRGLSVHPRPAWLSLDAGDNDPLRFFSYLLAALRAVDERIGTTAQRLLDAAQVAPAEPLVTALINDIAATSKPLLLVLDDYHTIEELAIHEAVGFLLEHQPPTMHLVIVTRLDPPLPLSRLRGRGQMTEIRQSDLRFTPGEAAQFLNESMGLRLTPSEIATLDERTEGWITGLQLAALSMQGRDAESITHFIGGFSGRYPHILDYLTDEVLRSQSESLQTFLLQTSILARMCGPLCDAIFNSESTVRGQQMLEHLESANLFTLPLDDERRWYRYHALFAELLQARLQETQPDQIPELHRRAAAWFERNGFSSDAVHHALATRDSLLAADVIQAAIVQVTTWSHADVAMILGWLQALPEPVVKNRPWLRLFTSRALYVSGQPEVASQMLRGLEIWLREHPTVPDSERLLGLVAADRASYAAVLGNVAEAKEFAQRALADLPDDDPIARFRAPAILGMAHFRAGEVREAHRAFSEAVDIALAAGLTFAAVPFLCNLAEMLILQGQLHQALEICQQAMELSAVDGERATTAGFVELQLGKILYEWNDLEAAEAHLVEAVELLSHGGISESFGSVHGILAFAKQALGDQEGARAAAQQALQSAQRDGIPRLITLASAHQAHIWLLQGRVDLAARWAREYQQVGETEYLREFEDLTLARCLLAQGKTAEALALLDALLAPAEEAGRLKSVLEIQIQRAVALSILSRPSPDEALEALTQALGLAEPEGHVRAFADAGEPMRTLLKQAGSRGIAPRYVGHLIAAFGTLDRPAPTVSETQPLAEPLTDRELEVLQLLADRLSNREIMQRLFISLATVKSHTSSIYGKLGVHSRDEAVSQARALGILPPV